MPTGVLAWSQTAASNATADSAVNWAEGMAPSAVNDSGRGVMASVAKWRDDIHGLLETGGSGSAYTLTTNQTIASNLAGATFQFTPGTTNTGAVTLSVDSNTAKPLRYLTGVDLTAGVLIEGSLYQVTYNNVSEEWLLHSFDARQYVIPIGAVLPYFGTTAPNSAFVLAYGQAISRTTYATLFALFSTTYGVGDGSTTFNVPDLRGRVIAGKDDMGGASANRLTDQTGGLDGDVLGDTGGSETHTLTEAQLASHTHTVTTSPHSHTTTLGRHSTDSGSGGAIGYYTYSGGNQTNSDVASSSASPSGTAASTGGGAAHNNVQPTIIANYILRVI